MKPIFPIVIIVSSLFLLLSACQISEEEAIETAHQTFINSFATDEGPAANYEGEQLNLFLPRGVDVVEEIEFNLHMERNDQIFLLFFIPFEPWNSEVHLLRDQEFQSDALVFKEVEENNKKGYLIISKEEDGQYKVIVGIGGAKITTISSVADLVDSIKVITEILHSVQYKD